MKVWKCNTCGKSTTDETPNDDAAPEHVSYRGHDIGTCPGKMELQDDMYKRD